MCKNKKRIVFCTCNKDKLNNIIESNLESFKVLADKQEYNKTYYSWSIERIVKEYSEKEKEMMIGEMFLPSKKLMKI